MAEETMFRGLWTCPGYGLLTCGGFELTEAGAHVIVDHLMRRTPEPQPPPPTKSIPSDPVAWQAESQQQIADQFNDTNHNLRRIANALEGILADLTKHP